MADESFTKIAGSLLAGVKGLVDWGVDGGHTTIAKMRLTIAARGEEVARLKAAGITQRQIAKVLEVDEGTVRNDLRNKSARVRKSSADKAKRRARHEARLAEFQASLPDGKYAVIVADPPWRFEPYSRETGMDRAADNHYPTMETQDIAGMPVMNIAADDCVLFLWATAPMLRDAMAVMAAWGFEYQTCAVWDKVHIGTGQWFRNRHEMLLLGTRGEPPCPAAGDQFASVLTITRKEHSAKPPQFLEMIEQYFPSLPKIELFRRGPPRPDWDAWGNEVEQAAE